MELYTDVLLKFESQYLIQLLRESNNNITTASKLSGLQRHQIKRMLLRNNIELPDLLNLTISRSRAKSKRWPKCN